MRFVRHLIGLGLASACFFVGCQHKPVQEFILADVALRSAQKAKADVLAADTFRKAENFFLRAKRDYQEGYFDSCKKYATEARTLAEQAEYLAILKQNQTKEAPNPE